LFWQQLSDELKTGTHTNRELRLKEGCLQTELAAQLALQNGLPHARYPRFVPHIKRSLMRPYPEFPIAYITEGLPGIGGKLKTEPEDFKVTELPAYTPQGSGEHLYIYFEKRDQSTPEIVTKIAQSLGLKPFEIGVAGRKDRRAVTRQWVSLPLVQGKKVDPERAKEIFTAAGATVLEANYHNNKLRTGHLTANKFELIVRGAAEGALPKAEAIVEKLKATGIPNFFGAQRFGDRGKNVIRGRAILEGKRRSHGTDTRFDASAIQSELFNRYLVKRMQKGLFDKALLGDVLKKHETGGIFICEDQESEQKRVEAFKISPTGPIFGAKMLDPKGDALALEEEILQEAQFTREQFEKVKHIMPGSRRINRLILPELSVSEVPEGLRFVFTLPKGAYATVLLGEIQKANANVEEIEEGNDE
jgi:tRNA pseudouridine13 synthase